jgi:adenine-specific DNA-methyltransferase
MSVIRGPFTLNDACAYVHQADAVAFMKALNVESTDLILTSPPYCIGKEYDNSRTLDAFIEEFDRSLDAIIDAMKPGGAVCWQVGHHVANGSIMPLDAIIIERLRCRSELSLRNRIIWGFAHGAHAKKRFSGRHETILWYSKGEPACFNLDAVRVPQKYPGKRHYKGPRKGELSGNPLGKNPGDVWDIPNVKSRHPEKTAHPCQFPVALAARLIRALTKPGALVVDPYVGSGSCAIASLSEGRNFRGCDIEKAYIDIAVARLEKLIAGELQMRPDRPPRNPSPTEAVARKPEHFWTSGFGEISV